MRTQGGDEEVLTQATGRSRSAFSGFQRRCLFQQLLNLIEGVDGALFHEGSFPKIPLRNVRDQMDRNWAFFLDLKGNVKSSSYSGISASKERENLSMTLSLCS